MTSGTYNQAFDPRLKGINFEMSLDRLVVDRETGQRIPFAVIRTFTFSAPYRQTQGPSKGKVKPDENRVSLENSCGGFGGRDFFYGWPAMTRKVAEDLTMKYIKNNFLDTRARDVKITNVREAFFEKPEERKGFILNAFETKGTILLYIGP
jgi:hypothetical protein